MTSRANKMITVFSGMYLKVLVIFFGSMTLELHNFSHWSKSTRDRFFNRIFKGLKQVSDEFPPGGTGLSLPSEMTTSCSCDESTDGTGMVLHTEKTTSCSWNESSTDGSGLLLQSEMSEMATFWGRKESSTDGTGRLFFCFDISSRFFIFL